MRLKFLFELSLSIMVLVLWLSFTNGPSIGLTTYNLTLPDKSSQSSIWNDTEKKCLSQVVWSEARGESLEGQLAVAIVALNRTADGRFNPRGKSLCSVVHQKDQFAYSNKTNPTTDMIAELATEQYGAIPDNARQWMFFQRGNHKGATKIAHHNFYV